MRIAILTLTTTNRVTGVAEYLINLLENLQQIDHVNEYYIFTSLDNRYMFKLNNKNFHEIVVKLRHDPWIVQRPLYHIWQRMYLPRWCSRNKIDILHLPNTLFVPSNMNVVVTVHDIADIKTKKYSFLRTKIRKKMIYSIINEASSIITVSESTANDIRALGGTNVTTIYNGFIHHGSQYNNGEEILERYGLKKKSYFLFIGTFLKHKNIDRLIYAYKEFLKTNDTIDLVLMGAPDNASKEIAKMILKEELGEKIKLMNYVDKNTKEVILKNASLFCMLSSYEGFGFPVLESQSLGTPVLTSNVSSLPEVAGYGAVTVDPHNIQEISKHMIQILNDKELQKKIIQNGYVNIKRFSWNQCAVETLKMYQTVFLKLKN